MHTYNTPLKNVMDYLDDMEVIDSDIMEKVLKMTADCDINHFTEADVTATLQ